MLTLNDGRSELWQWDTGRKLTVDADCSQVHFSNKVFGRSIDVDVVNSVAVIPDILLQTDKDLTAWAFVGTAENGYTKISKVFKVNKRNKPADYVFTPPEQTTLEEIKEKLDYLESIQDPDAIKNSVEDYLDQNPVEAPVQSVNGKTGEVELTAEDVGAISRNDLQEATNEALAQAKASGEFDGKDGIDGYTPIKGVDYFDGKDGHPGTDGKDGQDYVLTEADKQEIAEQAAQLVDVPDIPDIDIPTKLPNPHALTFTGAVSATYDGSAAVSVAIPKGGSGGGEVETLVDVTFSEAVTAFEHKFTDDEVDKINAAKTIRMIFTSPIAGVGSLTGVTFGIYKTNWYSYSERFANNISYQSSTGDTIAFNYAIINLPFGQYGTKTVCDGVNGVRGSVTNTIVAASSYLTKGTDLLKLTTTMEAGFPIGTSVKVEVIR